MPRAVSGSKGCAVLALVTAFVTGPLTREARADAPNAFDRAAAQRAFDEGRALFAQGKTPEACSRFAKSLELDRQGGTLLNLAICHRKAGRIGSALLEFTEARNMASRDSRKDRERFAADQIAELTPIVPRVVFDVSAEARAQSVTITLDDIAVRPAAWGETLPVDSGAHVVVITREGYQAAHSVVQTAADGALTHVSVKGLEPDISRAVASAPLPPIAAPSGGGEAHPPTTPETAHGHALAAGVLGGVGVLGLAAGTIFGLKTISDRNDAESLCRRGECNPAGISTNDHAKTEGWVSTAAFGVGAASLVAASYFAFFAPRGSAKARVGVGPSPGGAALTLAGSF